MTALSEIPLDAAVSRVVQFEVFLVEKINILFFWVFFTLDAGRWVLMFPEMLVPFHQTTWHHIP